MDDLAAQLATSFQVTKEPNTTAAPHPRFSDYKSKTPGFADQEVRRKEILDHQKKKRFDFQSHVRRLTEGNWEDLSDEEEDDNEEEMEVQQTFKPFRKPGRDYRNQLMFSEWMVDVPEDFEEEWIMVPCPLGKRNLVVASHGRTATFSKAGWPINTFTSKLPGGSRCGRWQIESTILDCIFSEITNTFYVLDMMSWKEMPLYETETEFRFYWMNDKLSEIPELKKITKNHKYRFEALPNFSCRGANISNVLSAQINIDLDGLLFYHKRTHYTFGVTPLVTWLKPYMLPEILKVTVPSKYTSLKPKTYTTFEAHVEQVKQEKVRAEEKKAKEEAKAEAKRNKKKKNKGRKSQENSGDGSQNTVMDATSDSVNETVETASNLPETASNLPETASNLPESGLEITASGSTWPLRPILGNVSQ